MESRSVTNNDIWIGGTNNMIMNALKNSLAASIINEANNILINNTQEITDILVSISTLNEYELVFVAIISDNITNIKVRNSTNEVLINDDVEIVTVGDGAVIRYKITVDRSA